MWEPLFVSNVSIYRRIVLNYQMWVPYINTKAVIIDLLINNHGHTTVDVSFMAPCMAIVEMMVCPWSIMVDEIGQYVGLCYFCASKCTTHSPNMYLDCSLCVRIHYKYSTSYQHTFDAINHLEVEGWCPHWMLCT